MITAVGLLSRPLIPEIPGADTFEGAAWQVADVGFLSSHVCRDGAVHRIQNRAVLDARMHGAPHELATH